MFPQFSDMEGGLIELSRQNMDDVLLRECEEYQQLTVRHSELDEMLTNLTTKLLLSAEEKIEEVRLKKKKLRIKDRMAQMRRSH